jgi:hypothetical protein
MLADRLHHFLASPSTKSEGNRAFWLTLGLVFSVLFSYLALTEAFAGDYIVQDDARQHVFWMQRYLDPALFPGDRIADYFQSVAPYGYKAVYRILMAGDISPWWVNKLLPPVLGIISTAYCFGIAMQLLPVPMAGFLATLLLNQSLWMKDDLISATPRAFVYPVFLAFLFYLLRRSPLGTALSALLIGLFYPQYSLIAIGLLGVQLLRWQPNPSDPTWRRYVPVRFRRDRRGYWIYGIALGLSIGILAVYANTSSEFDPVISAASTREWPELLPGGRSTFFYPNPLEFYFTGQRSGMLDVGLVRPASLLFALGLPVILRWRSQFPLASRLTDKLWILPQLLGVSVFWFIAAHATLFRLHLPTRYTEHSWRIVFALAAALTLTLVVDRLFQFWEPESDTLPTGLRWGGMVLMGAIAVLIVIYPRFVVDFPSTKYKVGEFPDLYTYVQQQPLGTMVASLSEEADNLPSFSQRSILVGREYAIPYHWGYYGEFRSRAAALVTAQYTPNLQTLKDFIETYGITLWLLERNAFEPAYVENGWFNQYPAPTAQALQILREGTVPALSLLQDSCTVWSEGRMSVLDAACIAQTETLPTAETDAEAADDGNEEDDGDEA